MKRLTLLAAALVMVLGFAVSASAAPEVTVSGNILVNAVWGSNWDFNDGNASTPGENDQAMWIRERFNLGFTAVANENLKGVIILRSTRQSFGQGGFANGAGGAGGGGGGDTIGVNQAYIDFSWPGTSVNVKAGFQPIALPAAVGGGSMIQDDIATGVMVSTNLTDGVDLLAGWTRFNDRSITGGGNTATGLTDSAIDGWIVALPLSFEGFSMAPFFVYTDLGENALGAAVDAKNIYWAGSSFELSMLDPFILKADINYGKQSADQDAADATGWLADVAVEYTGFDFMNLEFAFAWMSGEDDDATNGSERMPILSDSWALGSFWFGGGLITGDDIGDGDNVGFWALALSATGIQSFAEGLTHDAHIVYAKGTNDERSTGRLTYGRSLTEEDSMLEIDFNTMYKVYDELTLYNGIGYINLDADDSATAWGANNDGGDAWKFQVGAVYQF